MIFAANGTKQSIDDLKAAGATIMDEAKNIGLRPHFSFCMLPKP